MLLNIRAGRRSMDKLMITLIHRTKSKRHENHDHSVRGLAAWSPRRETRDLLGAV